MSKFFKFMGHRRFNYIDLGAYAAFIALWEAGQWIAAIAAIVALTLVSITVEHNS